MSPLSTSQLRQKFSEALELLLERGLTAKDGLKPSALVACERKLKLKLPRSLRIYYQLGGNLSLNKEHNILYAPEQLKKLHDKLLFMQENQAVVFWGLDIKSLHQADPEVFQAAKATPLIWYSEGLAFSDFILKMWRWQRGFKKE